MFASLPMYAAPHADAAHAALWAGIRDRLRADGLDAPEALDQETPPMEGWARPDLLLGQICNLPLRARFLGRVTIIGHADYDIEGAAPGQYYSVFIARADDPAETLADCAGYRFALNEPLSNSGWGAALAAAEAAGIALRPTVKTGAHRQSLAAVAEGRADLAALDVNTWQRVLSHDPNRARVKVVGRTAASPGMTFITAPGRDPAPIRDALEAAIADLAPEHRATLGLRGVVDAAPDAFAAPLPPEPVFA